MINRTVIFIHGMFMSASAWDDWVELFKSKGYNVLAPGWPGRDKPPDVLRRELDPAVAQLTLPALVDFYAGIAGQLPDAPILIGHSMGGLILQLLMRRGLGAAGVAIDPAPPQGVLSAKLSFWRSAWPVVNFLASANKPNLMPFKTWQYSWVHTLPEEKQHEAYERFVVPESRRVGRGALTNAAAVDFAAPHPPLLFIAGAADRLIPAGLVKKVAAKYQSKSPSLTDYKEFPGRTHFICGQDGWQEVAGYVLEWLDNQPAANR
jgi:pimeloyl-ACP methyl ester carboxylesterase